MVTIRCDQGCYKDRFCNSDLLLLTGEMSFFFNFVYSTVPGTYRAPATKEERKGGIHIQKCFGNYKPHAYTRAEYYYCFH